MRSSRRALTRSSLSGMGFMIASCGLVGRDNEAVAASHACTAKLNLFFSPCSLLCTPCEIYKRKKYVERLFAS